jgi:hypothetical protein
VRLVEKNVSFAFDVLRQGASLGAFIPTERGYALRSSVRVPQNVAEATAMRIGALKSAYPSATRAVTVAAALGRFVSLEAWTVAMERLSATLTSSDIDTLLRHELVKPLRSGFQFASDDERHRIADHLAPDDARALLQADRADSPTWNLLRSELLERTGDVSGAIATMMAIDLEVLRENGFLTERWFQRAAELKQLIPEPDANLEAWTELVSIRSSRSTAPHLRFEQIEAAIRKWGSKIDSRVSWALSAAQAVAYCHNGREAEGGEIASQLLEEPLPDWLVGGVRYTVGWVLFIGNDPAGDDVLKRAIEELTAVGHMSGASMAALTLAISETSDTEEIWRNRFEHALEFSLKATSLSQLPRIFLERSLSAMVKGYNSPLLEDARKAARLGPWSPAWMRTAFGANHAICLAYSGDSIAAREILEATRERTLDGDELGHTEVHATRCVIAAIEGNESEWDRLTAEPLEVRLPGFFGFLTSRSWKERNDERRRESAERYFSAEKTPET